MCLWLDVPHCDRQSQTYSELVLRNLLAWFITDLKLQAELPFDSSLPSQTEGFHKTFPPEKSGDVSVRFTPYLAGGQG